VLLEETQVSRPEGENGAVFGLILVLVNDSILHWLVLKFTLEQATKAKNGSGGIALLFP
jgi:hypothetical protein